jgi:predicted Zn finger-like uncharacterized protein
MILTCPACATSYFVPDDSIGATGRKVRCQSCAHVWRASLADEPLDLVQTTAEPEPFRAAPETLAETPAPELPKAFRARAEQQRRLRRAATHGAVWAGLASVFVGLIAAGWLFRVEVVDIYPRAAAAYAMVGTPVNPTGLEFEAITAHASPEDPERVLVSGALRNVRDNEVVAPPVRVALLDAHGDEVGQAVVRIDAAPVLPGKVQGFAVMIADPARKALGVGVDFTVIEDKAEAATPHGPAHRPLPTPDAPALRPALSRDQPALTPVDATPIDAAPVEGGLRQAVSTAGHG